MRFLAWIGFLGLLGATGAMAGSYAWSVGVSHGEPWAWIAASGAAALLVVESALAAGRGTGEPWLRWPALVLALLSVASLEVGFASSVFSDARAARAREAGDTVRASRVTEPAAVLRVRLEGIEARSPGLSARWCAAKAAGARDACDAWLQTREALAAAEDVEQSRSARTTGDADARAALLNRVFGGAEARWADWLVLLLATAMSLARAAAASMLLGNRAAVEASPRSAQAPVPVAETPADRHIEPATLEPVHQPKPVAPVPELPEPARKVLRVVAERAQPAAPGLGYLGFVPPGELSQRSLANAAGVSRRTVADSLQQLEAAGVVRVQVRGRDGTEFTLLRAS